MFKLCKIIFIILYDKGKIQQKHSNICSRLLKLVFKGSYFSVRINVWKPLARAKAQVPLSKLAKARQTHWIKAQISMPTNSFLKIFLK